MRFLIDENVHKGLYYFLINLEYDVKLTPKSTRNGNLFSLIVAEERILITRDSDFLNISKYSHLNHKGIILLRIHPKDLTQQKKALSKLFSLEINTKNKIIIIYSLEKFEFVHKND